MQQNLGVVHWHSCVSPCAPLHAWAAFAGAPGGLRLTCGVVDRAAHVGQKSSQNNAVDREEVWTEWKGSDRRHDMIWKVGQLVAPGGAASCLGLLPSSTPQLSRFSDLRPRGAEDNARSATF